MAEQEQEIPEYKKEFLNSLQKEYEQEQQQNNTQNLQNTNTEDKFNLPTLNKVTNTNDVWNSYQYSNKNWRGNLTTSYYNKEHNEKQFDLAAQLNPEVVEQRNNIKVTQISEYSNALHNNRVFQNPKFTSC